MDLYSIESLSAVGIAGAFLSTLIWILGQTRSAISAVISQNLGAGKIDEIKTLPAQAVFFNILLSLVVLASTYFFAEEIFSLLNAEGMILDLSLEYYNIRVWGFPLTLFTFAIFGIFRGLQNTFWPMVVAMSGAVINIGLDFALVYGIEDIIAPMGVKGAAWASLIAQGLMAIMSLIFVLVKTDISLRLRFPLHKEINRLVVMSLNLFVRSLSLNIALVLAVKEATALGKETIAAHTIAVNIWLFTAFFIDGYGAAGNVLGGRLLGAKSYKDLWTLTKRLNLYNLIVAALLMSVAFIFYRSSGLIFSKDDTVLQAFYSVFFIVILMQPLNSIAFTLDAIFKGLGETAYLRNTLLGATFLGFVPMIYLSKYLEWGFIGIWIAFVVWMFIRSSALIFKYHNTYYKLAKK
jgi:putative MATE family efflux protein